MVERQRGASYRGRCQMSATTRDVDDVLKTLVDRGTISIVLGGFALFGPGADSLCRTKNAQESVEMTLGRLPGEGAGGT